MKETKEYLHLWGVFESHNL